MPEKEAALKAVQDARAELADAAVLAARAHTSASELSAAIDGFRADTARRLNPWRLVATTVAGAFLAGLLSLSVFLYAASTCSLDEGGYCTILAPTSDAQEATFNNLISAQLHGTEYLLDGGTAEAFLAGDAARSADLVTILKPDGDGTWTVISADASAEILTLTGLDFTSLPSPQEAIFGEDPEDSAVLAAAKDALVSRLPQSTSRMITTKNIRFMSRVVPHGPSTVAVFTTIIQ